MNQLELLTHLEGARYAERRDAVLARLPDLDEAGSDWKLATQARILAGWRDHRSLYEQVIARFETADLEQARRTHTGIAGVQDRFANAALEEWKQDVLPLCWEILLKFDREWPRGLKGGGGVAPSEAWRITAAVRMVVVLPDPSSVQPLVWFIEHTRHDEARGVAAIALAQLPEADVRAAVAEAQVRNAALEAPNEGVEFALGRALRALERKKTEPR